MKDKIFLVLSIICFLVSIGLMSYLSFSNVDMTNTRLFITYWKQYIIIFLLFALSSIFFNKAMNKPIN